MSIRCHLDSLKQFAASSNSTFGDLLVYPSDIDVVLGRHTLAAVLGGNADRLIPR